MSGQRVEQLADDVTYLGDCREVLPVLDGMSVTRFGKSSLNDESFVHDLKRGRSPSLLTIDRVREFMDRSHRGTAA